MPLRYTALGKGCLFIDGDWIESKNISSEGIKYLTTGNVGPGYYKEQGSGFITEETFRELNCTEVFPGDLLISRLNEPIARTCIVPELHSRIVTAVDNVIYRPNPQICEKRYVCYWLNNAKLTEHANILARGATMHRISRTILGHIPVLLPPLNEQSLIADYLDKECSNIDVIIAKEEKRLNLLRELRQSIITKAVTKGINPDSALKDSGIEWIGEIPKHWDLKRIKHISSIHGRVGYKGYTTADLVSEGDGAYTIGGKHISRNILDLSEPEYINWDKYYESPEIMVHKGDIITAQRGTLGRTALVKEDIGPATINPSLVLINGIKINNEFLYWWMVSDSVLSEIALLNTSTAVPMISQFQIANIRIPVPPQKEQEQICCFIRKEIKQVDKSIEKTEHQIKLLREYKQSLITEVVTGKRKVC